MSSDDDIEYIETTRKPSRAASNSNSDADDSVEEQNKPSGAECLSRCKQFAEITDTDTALAMFFLQDTDWDLEKSLEAYFRQTKQSNSKIVACMDVDKLNKDERKHARSSANKRDSSEDESNTSKRSKSSETSEIESSPELVTVLRGAQKANSSQASSETASSSSSCSPTATINESQDKDKDKHFKLLSWNIDGLDKDSPSLTNRTLGVVAKIMSEKPDLVFLQEVIKPAEQILRERLGKNYTFSSGYASCEYYTAILTKTSTCKLHSDSSLVDFENSRMGRNLLQVKLTYKNQVEVCAMTAHLESTADFSKQRVQQLQRCFATMSQLGPEYVVFFGGDMNLRDSEIAAIGGLPRDIHDMWESTGKRKECLYTWDTMRNTNLTMNGKFKPRCRFDRLYYRASKWTGSDDGDDTTKHMTLMPVYFELEGLEKLKSCNRFCSDHWAIQAYCQLEVQPSA